MIDPSSGGARRRNPWWIPPFLGRVPEAVTPGHLKVLGAVSFAIFFENYDQALLTQAVKQIAADFRIAEADIGNLLGFVRIGAFPAFLLIPFADRIGRRRLFLLSVLGMSLFTVCSAIAPIVEVFVGLQMLARMFMVTASATAYVIVTEELTAQHRGWALGIVGAVGAFGVGLSAGVFSMIDWLPYGWRAMYVVGLLPLALLPWLRGRVSETQRFRDHQAARVGPGHGWLTPVARLFAAYPARATLVGLIGALSSAGHAAGYNFSAYFVQSTHGWSPGDYALMLVVAGGVGVLGHPVAGRLADARGRRSVGFAFYAAFPLLALAFYTGPGWAVPIVWVPMVFTVTGGITITRAFSTELFPTSHRGTASGWLQLAEVLGAGAGLFLVSYLTPDDASTIPAVRIVCFLTLVAALSVLALPESGGRELEEVSAER